MYRRPLLLAGIASLSVFSGLALAQSMSSTSAEKAMRYSERPDVKKFIADVSRRRGLDSEWVAEILDKATYQPRIERLMTPKKSKPGTRDSRRDWEKYRSIFLGRDRLNLGARFWRDNQETLERARKEFGVDPAVIVGIIGVETRYGENTGSWKVLDSLVTLSFDYKRRADFFKKELEEYLVFINKNQYHPNDVLGSYAGAVGLPQFMPSSIKRFGVDFDGDGKIDINTSAADTIGSIANYLSKHGWIEGAPMVLEADISEENARKFGGGTTAKFRWQTLQNNGVNPSPTVKKEPADLPVFIVDFPFYPDGSNVSKKLYRVGTRNFTSVLRYNSSYFYAGAVAELGTAIAALMQQPGLIDGGPILPKKETIELDPTGKGLKPDQIQVKVTPVA